jgi:hypothetical protein
MSNKTALTQDTLRTEIGREIERMSSTISRQFADIIANARWFTTLVIAEVAGIVRFTETFHGARFIVMVIALLALALAAVSLIIAIVRAQYVKNYIETEATKLAMDLPTTDLSDATTEQVAGLLAALKKSLDSTNDETDAVVYSNVGLVAFLVGTIFAGAALIV